MLPVLFLYVCGVGGGWSSVCVCGKVVFECRCVCRRGLVECMCVGGGWVCVCYGGGSCTCVWEELV